ncbi:MAG: hypothetical protein ACYDB0_02000 [Acidithiobacillus sp.]
MNPDDHIHIEQAGNMLVVRFSKLMQRVFRRADADPRMMQLDRLMAEAKDKQTAWLILNEMAVRLEELARLEEMQ